MAIVKMSRLSVISMAEHEEDILCSLQEFGGVELTLSEDYIPDPALLREKPEVLSRALLVLSLFEKKGSLLDMREGLPRSTIAELECEVAESGWEQRAGEAVETSEALETLRSRRQEITSQKSGLYHWKSLGVSTGELSSLQSGCALGMIPTGYREELLEALEKQTEGNFYSEIIFENDTAAGFLLFYPRKKRRNIASMLREFSFTEYRPDEKLSPGEQIDAFDEEDAGLAEEEKRLLDKLDELAGNLSVLRRVEDYYDNLLMRAEAGAQLNRSRTTVAIEGWIPTEKEAALSGALDSLLGDEEYYLEYGAVATTEENVDEVPIALKNNRVFRAFENLTEMYSMPKYNEIDPTPFTAPFYMAFFGMMVADLGYGLVMFLGLLAAKLFLRNNREMRHKLDFFYYLSFPIMVWGLLFGSFFGLDLPFQLVSATTDIIPLLVISLGLGWIQITFGLILSAFINFKQKDIWTGIGDGVSWVFLMVGLLVMVLSQLVFPSQMFFYIGVGLCILAALGIIIAPMVKDRSKIKGLAKGLYALYGVTSYIGDLVSYTRLMALGVAGASIALAFNTILSYLPFPVMVTAGVLLAIVLHALNIFLSLLSAYVHGIRLQFVEFFGKFYSGGGRKFSPFKTVDRNVVIEAEDAH